MITNELEYFLILKNMGWSYDDITGIVKSHKNKEINTKIIAEVIESLNKFLNPIFEYHRKNNSVDDIELSIDYIRDIYEKEGSLFEDNFYTQLIRNRHIFYDNLHLRLLLI
jgi:hypothetical protein